MDYAPDTDDDYTLPIHSLEDRVANLRVLGTLIKAGLYDSDETEREAAHKAFDAIVERGIINEQKNFILLKENTALKEEVYRIKKHNDRLQAFNDELTWKLGLYENDDIETAGENLTSDDRSASSPPTASQNIQPEAAFLSGPDTALSQSEGDVDIVPPRAVTDEGEGGRRHNSKTGCTPDNKDVQELLKTIKPDKSREVALKLRGMAQDAKEQLENMRKKLQFLMDEEDQDGVEELARRIRELQNSLASYNRLASKIYFNGLNPCYYHVPDDTVRQSNDYPDIPSHSLARIDLHNMTVPEARLLAWEHVLFCRIRGIKETEIICGRGRHSKDGKPKLRPALLASMCRAANIHIKVHKRNPGRLVVLLLDEPPMTTNDDASEIDEDMEFEVR